MSEMNGTSATKIPDADRLARWNGGSARIWDYSPTLSTLTIRISRSKPTGNLHIVCNGTQYYSGPTYWENCGLEVGSVTCDGETVRILRDSGNGFELRCEVVGFVENVEPVFQTKTAAAAVP